MKIGRLIASGLAVVAVLSVISSNATAGPDRLPKRSEIAFTDFDSSSPQIVYHDGGKPAGTMRLYQSRTQDLVFAVKPNHSRETTIALNVEEWPGRGKFGVVCIDGKAGEDLFVVTDTGGTGVLFRSLYVLNPRLRQVLRLDMTFDRNASQAEVPGVERSDNFDNSLLAREKAFLEAIKCEYDFKSQEQAEENGEDPENADYFWNKDNGNVRNGPLRIRKLKGDIGHAWGVQATNTLNDGNITYTAYFKSGVVAYDRKSDESWLVFYPEDRYRYVNVLRKRGAMLFIGTNGEGLVVVNVETPYIRRFPKIGERGFDGTIWNMGITGDELVIGGKSRFPLRMFEKPE